jgi:hypothetical protein
MPSMSSLTDPRDAARQTAGRADVASWRNRVPWGDLAVLVASGALLAILYRSCGASPDEGLITTSAERILRGQVPYRDFFSELGPGSFFVEAIIFRLAGTSLSSVFLSVWSLGVAITWLLYRLSKKLLPRPWSFFPPLTMVTVCYGHNYMVSHHWWSILFFLLMVLCLVKLCSPKGASQGVQRMLWLAVAGSFGVATLVCMQSLGAWAIVITVIWLVWLGRLDAQANPRGAFWIKWGPVLGYLLGAGTVLGLGMEYFWARGALGALVYDNFTFLFTHYIPYQSFRDAYTWNRLASALLSAVQDPSIRSIASAAGFYFFALVGPAVALGGGILEYRRRKTMDDSRSRLLLLYLLAGAGCYISQLHEPEIHHLIWGSTLILILFAESWSLAAYQRTAWRRQVMAGGGLILLAVLVGGSMKAAQVVNGRTLVQSRRGRFYATSGNAASYQRWIEVIERDVPPGGETFVVPYEAQIYFLTATRNPTRYDTLLSNFHSRAQFAEAMDSLWRERPKYIFNFEPAEGFLYDKGSAVDADDSSEPNLLVKTLHSGQSPYTLAEKVAGMEVWTLKQ